MRTKEENKMKDLNKLSFAELQKEVEQLSKKKESIGKKSVGS